MKILNRKQCRDIIKFQEEVLKEMEAQLLTKHQLIKRGNLKERSFYSIFDPGHNITLASMSNIAEALDCELEIFLRYKGKNK